MLSLRCQCALVLLAAVALGARVDEDPPAKAGEPRKLGDDLPKAPEGSGSASEGASSGETDLKEMEKTLDEPTAVAPGSASTGKTAGGEDLFPEKLFSFPAAEKQVVPPPTPPPTRMLVPVTDEEAEYTGKIATKIANALQPKAGEKSEVHKPEAPGSASAAQAEGAADATDVAQAKTGVAEAAAEDSADDVKKAEQDAEAAMQGVEQAAVDAPLAEAAPAEVAEAVTPAAENAA